VQKGINSDSKDSLTLQHYHVKNLKGKKLLRTTWSKDYMERKTRNGKKRKRKTLNGKKRKEVEIEK
jgi:hypothetical protein